MPMKLTVLGVLAAIALGAAGLLRDASTSYASHGVAIQSFGATYSICYGGSVPAPGSILCPGSSGTDAATSSSATQTAVIALPIGSRLTLPINYTPGCPTSAACAGGFAFSGGSVGANVGEVSAQVDLLCDYNDTVPGDNIDILSPNGADVTAGYATKDHLSPDNDATAWPNLTDNFWPGFTFFHQGTAPSGSDAYVSTIKPMPSTFTPVSHDKAELNRLWLSGGPGNLDLTALQTQPTPLNIVVEESPYTADLNVSVALLGGDPAPPTNSFICLDSSQDSIATNTQTTTPTSAGLYARWTVFTSADDIRSGTVSRVVDLNCVNVGAAVVTDADGDCLDSGSDANDAVADQDGDGLVDGIEAEFGTSQTAADTDADGSTDFFEMFFFTDPNMMDTDGDGSKDKHDNGADEVPGTVAVVDDTTADDNCPTDSNASQTNTDNADIPNGSTGDKTNGSADNTVNGGDACDNDDDNDELGDVSETSLHIDNAQTTNKCRKDPGPGMTYTLDPTTTTDSDSDDDLALDGIECRFKSNPKLATSRPASAGADSLEDGAAETFYRTQGINIAAGSAQNNNPDNDGSTTGDADSDSDNDGLLDGVEVKFYATKPSDSDSDHDGCSDSKEAASVNLDRSVTSADLSAIAQRFGGYRNVTTGVVDVNKATYDFNKDATIASADLSAVAQRFGACPAQNGIDPATNN